VTCSNGWPSYSMQVNASQYTMPQVLCCLCGISITSNPTNMCPNCLRSQVDITEGISKQLTVFWCRGCNRYQRPPWTVAARESPELLQLLMKKIRGIGKDIRVIEADFVYTEEHSMRLKIRLTIQKEVYAGAILQQQFIVEFIVANMQCPDCARSYTEHMWDTVVQVRQKVRHKKTFFYLEQLLLKHNICQKCIGIKEENGGLDFQWANRSNANVIINFLRSNTPTRHSESKKLISHNEQSNTATFKFTYLVEMVPLCRGDLVCLPKALARKLGGVSRLLLVYKVTALIHMIDPLTLRTVDLSAVQYWRTPFQALCTPSQLVEYVVLDTEMENENKYGGFDSNEKSNHIWDHHKFKLVECEVARESDLGVNDNTTRCLSHLGHLLNPGDAALGYNVENLNLPEIKSMNLPDVILVKKHFPERMQTRQKKRKFQLKNLPKDSLSIRANPRDEKDLEEFMQELEENPDMRAGVQMYARPEVLEQMQEEDDEDDDGFPSINMDELLSDMANIGI